MKHQAIIWDLDGTLLDTLQDLTASVNAALQAHGCPTRTLEEVRSFVGNGVRNLMLRAMPEAREVPDFMYGDGNSDGSINIKDLGLLQQYLNDWDVVLK